MQFIAVPAGKRVPDYYKEQPVILRRFSERGIHSASRPALANAAAGRPKPNPPEVKRTEVRAPSVPTAPGCAIADTLYRPNAGTVGERPSKGKVKTSPLRANKRVATIARISV